MEQTPIKLGWWASKSTGTKWFLAITGIAIIVGGGYLISTQFRRQEEPEKEKVNVPDESKDNSTVVPEEKKEEKKTELYTLPNKGIGCSDIIDNFDSNFSYVKCNGIWWTKSKENPSNVETKGKYPEWTSLETNEVQSKLLNTRYPKS